MYANLSAGGIERFYYNWQRGQRFLEIAFFLLYFQHLSDLVFASESLEWTFVLRHIVFNVDASQRKLRKLSESAM